VAHWKQRGKFKAIKEGDKNTRFFHIHASQRYCWNYVCELLVDGVVIVDHTGKEAALHGFYKELLERALPISWGLHLAALYHREQMVDGSALTTHFNEKEVKATIDGMDQGSAPGLDGLGPSLYRAAWPMVKLAMLHLFAAVHDRFAQLGAINRAHVILLPRIEGTPLPSSFCPVSL
jgi:hypothetical protein